MKNITFESSRIAKLFFKDMGSFPVLTKDKEVKKLKEINLLHYKVIALLINNEFFIKWLINRYSSRKKSKYKNRHLFSLLERYRKNKHFDYSKIIELFFENSINISYFFESNEWKIILRCVELYDLAKKEGKLFHINKSEIEIIKKLVVTVKKHKSSMKSFENHNLRLVISIASRILKKIDILEKIQYGAFGLRIALYMYNINSGFKFSTYATWWIEQSIRRNISSYQSTIRIPIHVVDDVSKLLTLKEKDETLTDEKLRETLGWSIVHYKAIIKSLPSFDVESIDSIFEEAENNEYKQAIDLTTPSPEENRNYNELKEIIATLMKTNLSKREYDVISMRFGLDGKGGKTLSEIGKHFNLSRERIRQIEGLAIKILKPKFKKMNLDIDYIIP